jgi:sarcosine oxidase subunit beta
VPEVVVIGGGVMGASVAWHLAARGCRDVLVLDRSPAPGQGSTGRATGGFRAQFATPVNIRLALLSREKLLRFPEEVGADSGYRPYGYLFLANKEEQMEALRSIRPLQQGLGVPVEEIGPEDVRRLNPAINPGGTAEGIVGGSFCPIDGFLRPLAILNGYVEAAKRLGVRFEYGVEATGFAIAKRLPGRVMGAGLESSGGSPGWRFRSLRCAGRWRRPCPPPRCRRRCR